MTTVLCEKEDCEYFEFKPNKGTAYQKQCGNDEIEIADMRDGTAQCLTYEKKVNDPAASNGASRR